MAPDDSERDGELALRIVAGADPDAEAELCRRLWPRVRSFGLRRLRSEQDALDLTQQVLIVVIESLRAGQVAEPQRIGAFVMGTSRNMLLDRFKVDRRRGQLLEQFGASSPTSFEPPPLLESRQLQRCLEGLKPRERTIVISTYVVEQDSAELAESLGMQAGAVRVMRHRALKQLLACLGGAS